MGGSLFLSASGPFSVGQSGPRGWDEGSLPAQEFPEWPGRPPLLQEGSLRVTGSGCCGPEQVALLLPSHLHNEQAGRTEWWVPEAPEASRAGRKPRFPLLRECEALQRALVPETDGCPPSEGPVLPALGSRGPHL